MVSLTATPVSIVLLGPGRDRFQRAVTSLGSV
jgi:hypothetical protein